GTGASLSYLAVDTGRFRVLPVTELVGWTFLNGKELAFPENVIHNAAGDTIVNAKVGLRVSLGDLSQPGFLSGSDIGISYGRPLTGEVIYKAPSRLGLGRGF